MTNFLSFSSPRRRAFEKKIGESRFDSPRQCYTKCYTNRSAVPTNCGRRLEGQPRADRHNARRRSAKRGSRRILRQALRCAKCSTVQIAINTVETGVVEHVLG